MPEVNAASPILPVSASAPVSGNTANTSVSQGNDGQPSFSQVLRDKQAAAADANANTTANAAAKTDADAAKAASTQAQDKTGKATDSKADKVQDSDSSGSADTVVAGKTPEEMAQLLAAAGLLSSVSNNQTATAGSAATTGNQLAAAEATGGVAGGAAVKTASDADLVAVLPQTDKTAATGAATAASLAAGTANTTTSAEQALVGQSQIAGSNGKSGQSSTSSGDQPGADKQPLAGVISTADAEKSHAASATTEASFSAALERASQNGEAAHVGAPPPTANVTQTQASQAPATVHVVNTPVGRQGWADEVGQRVLWTAKSDNSHADLVLNPPQLGRIEVSIHVNGDQASASFMVANPVAREALQDAMPRLRELMSQAGIQLGQADVGAGQSGQNSAQGERRQGGGNGSGMLAAAGTIGTTAGGWTRQGSGIVDTFA
ncbi:MAG: flagellar hook-length control protein [Rhodocyclales bacterium]|nr:flagellar hook-length control protein [Rhodocyclales bacterium]